jgi:hypothetical protein
MNGQVLLNFSSQSIIQSHFCVAVSSLSNLSIKIDSFPWVSGDSSLKVPVSQKIFDYINLLYFSCVNLSFVIGY